MRKFFFSIPVFLLLFSCNNNSGEKNEEKVQEIVINPENLVTIQMDVIGMTCTGCENTIIKSVSKLAGVQEVTASHLDSVSVIRFDSSLVSIDDIRMAIEEYGYQPNDFIYLSE